MADRIKIQAELEELLGSDHVYFQPPESAKLQYPCIIYYLTDIDGFHADNVNYETTFCYEATLVSKNENFDLADRILKHFPTCAYDGHYVSENLYCDAFMIYYKIIN